MDFPNIVWPPLNTITPWSMESLGGTIRTMTLANIVSGSVTANIVYIYPFALFQPETLVKLSWITGATNTGNIDIGIYDTWNLIANSGSTALGTANALNTADITDTVLQAGRYYLGCQFSSSSGTTFQHSTNADEAILPLTRLDQWDAGSFGLPSTIFGASISTDANPKVHAIAAHFNTLV